MKQVSRMIFEPLVKKIRFKEAEKYYSFFLCNNDGNKSIKITISQMTRITFFLVLDSSSSTILPLTTRICTQRSRVPYPYTNQYVRILFHSNFIG